MKISERKEKEVQEAGGGRSPPRMERNSAEVA